MAWKLAGRTFETACLPFSGPTTLSPSAAPYHGGSNSSLPIEPSNIPPMAERLNFASGMGRQISAHCSAEPQEESCREQLLVASRSPALFAARTRSLRLPPQPSATWMKRLALQPAGLSSTNRPSARGTAAPCDSARAMWRARRSSCWFRLACWAPSNPDIDSLRILHWRPRRKGLTYARVLSPPIETTSSFSEMSPSTGLIIAITSPSYIIVGRQR